MVTISEKRFGELIAASVRVSELESELKRMTSNFEQQAKNVEYWQVAYEDAGRAFKKLKESKTALEEVVSKQDAEIKELNSELEEAARRLTDIVITAIGAKQPLHATVAQQAERFTCNENVVGSIPIGSSRRLK